MRRYTELMAKPRWLLLASTFLAGMAIWTAIAPMQELYGQIISNGAQGGGGGSCSPSCVTSLNTLTGAVTLSAGANITLTPAGNDIEIAATGGSGTFADQAECEAGVVDNEIASPECVAQYFSVVFPSSATHDGEVMGTDGSTPRWQGFLIKNWVAARIQDGIASAGFSLPAAASSPVATPVTGTNRVYATLDWDDATDRFAYDEVQLPFTTLPAISAGVNVSTSNTSTNVVEMTIELACIDATGSNPDPSWNAAQSINITPTGTAGVPVFGSVALTLSGCAAGDLMAFRISRDRTDANTATAQLHSFTLYVPTH